jgi:hypothetical protein
LIVTTSDIGLAPKNSHDSLTALERVRQVRIRRVLRWRPRAIVH